MLILVINCGSSSCKYQLFQIGHDKPIVKGAVERIGEKNSGFKNHDEAMAFVRKRLLLGRKRPVKDVSEIKGIGHRVVHGGESFGEAALITKRVIKTIKDYVELAPLHNPPSLEGIRAARGYFRGIPQVAVFDTAFHQSMPPYAYIYGVPYVYYKKYGVRRYGFHGTSHRYIANEAARKLKKPINRLNLITVHLGNGSSMAAVKRGKSIDTTMGLTPLEGLLMGTRSGDLDPAIVTFLMEKERLKVPGMNNMLNKKSGLLGVSGISNDMRDILKNMRKGNKRAKLAFQIFLYRIKKYIGAYAAAMGGVDAVIFAGGIGENVPAIERTLAKDLGTVLGRKIKFLTIPTNEELLIAHDTYNLIKKKR